MKDKFSKKRQAILAAVVLYDVFGVPISINKLFRLCYDAAVSRKDFDSILSSLERQNVLARANGKVALVESKRILDRKDYSGNILQKQEKVLRAIAGMPFVKGVFLTNSLAFGTAHKNSDIDLIVVCKKNKLALARDLVKIYLSWVQKGKQEKAGRIAIDIWLDEKNLGIKDFRLQGEDIYFDFWLATAVPLFDDGVFAGFVSKNKIKEKFNNYKIDKSRIFKLPQGRLRVKKILEWLLGVKILSKFSDRQMIKRLQKYEKQVKGKGAILVSRDRLRFNIPDKRADIQNKFDGRFNH